MKLIVKVGIGVAAFIGLPVVALAMWYVCMAIQTEPEIHLIPDGYRGPIIIMYDMPNGDSIEYEDNKRILRIPPTGMLYTQFKQIEGLHEPGSIKYYYVYSDGSRKELLKVWQRPDIPDSTNIYIFGKENGVFQSNGVEKSFDEYHVGKSTDDGEEYAWRAHKMIRGK
jgi:hypothetical protein